MALILQKKRKETIQIIMDVYNNSLLGDTPKYNWDEVIRGILHGTTDNGIEIMFKF